MNTTILVVDDSATMRMILESALIHNGWRVITAANGQEALRFAQDQSVDLVVSDWNMPGMGGLQLIQNLREQSKCQNVPVLVLTTEEDTESKAAARDLGVSGWLNKPIDPDVLVELTYELLAGSMSDRLAVSALL
jgi:two-component system chemotaxis response regulator CheY